MPIDPAITPEGAIGAASKTVEQLPPSGSGSTAAPVLGEQVSIRALDVVGALLILIAEVREALTLVAAAPVLATVPQSLIPEYFPERPLLDPVISELPPLQGVVLVESAVPITQLLEDAVLEGMMPLISSHDVSLAETALTNAAVGVIYSTLGAPPAQLAPATAPPAVMQMMLRRIPSAESAPPATWLMTATQVEAVVRTALDKAFDAVTAWRDVSPAVVAVVGDARTAVLAALDEDPLNPLWLTPEMMRILPRMRRYWRLRRRLRRALDQGEAMQPGDRDAATPTCPDGHA
jgi:hypothetical protein